MRPTIRFTVEEAQAAGETWRFNCGPGALCAITGMSPAELRPHLGDFEAKGYTNPTLMASILKGLGIAFKRVYEAKGADAEQAGPWRYPRFGLMRVQWAGPWTASGVPMAARYRYTHWVAIDRVQSDDPIWMGDVFDVNAACVGGWIPWKEWTTDLVPWLLRECHPKASGAWWPTHCWEVPLPTEFRAPADFTNPKDGSNA